MDFFRVFESEPAKEAMKQHVRPRVLGYHVEKMKWLFRFTYACEKEQAKRVAREFLEQAYGADQIEFWANMDAKEAEFFATFRWNDGKGMYNQP